MARKVFFSFHFEQDYSRTAVVRNSWRTKPDRKSAGFWDKAKFEAVKARGDKAIQKWIDDSLVGTSVTVVLIGAETSSRPWVRYELQQSFQRGNGMLGIYIHDIKNLRKETTSKGNANFGPLAVLHGLEVNFRDLFPVYDWVNDDGYKNLGSWIEKAAKDMGK